MVIVDSNEMLELAKADMENEDVLIVPIFMSSHYHPKMNKVCLLYIQAIYSEKTYILPNDHYDCSTSQLQFLDQFNFGKIFVSKKNELNYSKRIKNSFDFDMVYYLEKGKAFGYPENKNFNFYWSIKGRQDIGKIIPIAKHIEWCKKASQKIISVIPELNKQEKPIYDFYELASAIFTVIENTGMPILQEAFINRFNGFMVKDGLARTKYNLYTTAGRPSNAFGGVNFGALNTSDGTRELFIPGDLKGRLVEIDYDGYHLRLIGKLTDYEFNNQSVHQQLGKQYFNKTTLTDDDYELSKSISFKALYGFIPPEYENIDFFKGIKIFIKELWTEFNIKGFFESPVSGRKMYKENFGDLNQTKLFNYYIQLYETERNILVMKNIIEFLKNKATKLIHYQYDAFLFDVPETEKDMMEELNVIVGQDGFTTKTKIGENYNTLKETTWQ
tara:strand:- start:104 stop:1435 length:1332 start_codon:yes stop_codon:yes gene_type:complete